MEKECKVPEDKHAREILLIKEEIARMKKIHGDQRASPSRSSSENPADEEYKPLQTYFPDEEVLFVGENIAELYPGWRLFFDGVVNFKGLGIGAVLISETGQHYLITAKLRFLYTNNMVEYEACILGLRLARDMNVRELLVIGDSDLLVHQVRDEWVVKPLRWNSHRSYA
ncbi:uncharacterized protein LOC124899550 [Capsicum annuum]|uniref:uncharacterized protein LOC124899550 n=1 Tax=Capsicum annuum TaxID=4072 RepID=UPI001FB164FD|nr:uncharacterized protein LOC124899550 [Capsicum annuum]